MNESWSGRAGRIAFIGILCAVWAAFAWPVVARADGFTLPSVKIDAEVMTNGWLEVTERRTFAFEDEGNGVWWSIPLATRKDGATVSVDPATVDVSVDEGGTVHRFARALEAKEGDEGIFVVDASGDEEVRIQVYRPFEDGETVTFILTYRLAHAATRWSDTGELYWMFVGRDWEEDAQDVSLTVTFAGADAAPAQAGETLRAWGHGPLDGTVEVDDAVPAVRVAVPQVAAGEFAEVRIAFPSAWIPAAAPQNEASLSSILSEEQAYADDANERREQRRFLTETGLLVPPVLAGVLALAVGALRVMQSRRLRPSLQERYLDELPSDDHPAVLSAVMNGGEVGERAFTATLMKLTLDGVVRPEDAADGEEDNRLALREMPGTLSSIDDAACAVFFSAGGGSASFKGMRAQARDDARRTAELMEAFRKAVRDELSRRGLVDSAAGWVRGIALGLGCALLIAGFAVFAMCGEATALAFLLTFVLVGAALVLSLTYRAQTREAVELRARCEAFRRWIEDFDKLGHPVPRDVSLWARMLVCAVAVGVSEEALAVAACHSPIEVHGHEPEGMGQMGEGVPYMPFVWWWILPGPHRSTAPISDAAASFDAAREAVSLESSGSGSGGGFSMGGGGGVGGGGGGTF